MADPQRTLDPGAGGSQARPKTDGPFIRGAVLLSICVLTCGVFAFLAGKEIGNQDLMFTLAFIFLGIVTVGIFVLAWVDNSTRQEHDFTYHH